MFLLFFISSLHADASSATNAPTNIFSVLPIILIMLVFYFLLIRPQQKKEKERVSMITATSIGDQIITNGGIIGTVQKILNEKEILVLIAENTVIKLLKSHIVENTTLLSRQNIATKPFKDKKPEVLEKSKGKKLELLNNEENNTVSDEKKK